MYEKRDLLQSVTSNRTVDQKSVVVKLREPFEALAKREKMSVGEPFRDVPRTEIRKLFDMLVDRFTTEPIKDSADQAA